MKMVFLIFDYSWENQIIMKNYISCKTFIFFANCRKVCGSFWQFVPNFKYFRFPIFMKTHEKNCSNSKIISKIEKKT